MKKQNFKKGDWLYFEFNLSQVKEVYKGKPSCVTNGYIRTGGSMGDLSDRCYPLDMDIKLISGAVDYWSKRFHALEHNSLNHPDLHRELVRRWVEICDNKDDDKKVQELYDKLATFGNSVLKKVKEVKEDISVEGVKLFH